MATRGKASRVCKTRKKMKTTYKENSSLFFWTMKILLLINELSFRVIFTHDKCAHILKHSWHYRHGMQNSYIWTTKQFLSNAYPIQTWPCTSAHTVQLNYAISYKLSPTKNADSKMHFGKYVIIQEVVFLSSCPDRSMYIYLVTGHEQYMVSNSFPLSIDH